MNIFDYQQLIINLPVMQQSLTTKRLTWVMHEANYAWLHQLNNHIFGDYESAQISRHDIFQTNNLREKVIKTIYWGYNSGMRGNHFSSILMHIDEIEAALQALLEIDNPTADDFNTFVDSMNGIAGIGISTYTKLLYFLGIRINNAPCLILDNRLINVFSHAEYENFAGLNGISYLNAHRYYLRYIQRMQELAGEMGTQGDNVEFFLFMFGGNLKQ
jgi:hypothetical protein